MGYIFITIITVLILYYLVAVKHGNQGFWKKAGRNPDLVYEQITQDEAWVTDEEITGRSKKGLDGPFLLYVPSLNRTVKFYGKVGEYEDSQKRIEMLL